ncbi:hypothetical protein SDC9_177474 [bioreactor metagenome]|uniref:Uncharacterized protein n=1 Tax=bioreactor metagenome TaxID=1076179 RepID=A0A645GSY2_9ZZZZ
MVLYKNSCILSFLRLAAGIGGSLYRKSYAFFDREKDNEKCHHFNEETAWIYPGGADHGSCRFGHPVFGYCPECFQCDGQSERRGGPGEFDDIEFRDPPVCLQCRKNHRRCFRWHVGRRGADAGSGGGRLSGRGNCAPTGGY